MSGELKYYPQHARVEEQFVKNTAEHVLTVKHDDGVYRHLLFRSPKASYYWFELVTWPGALTISGDMGTFTFRREEDMFGFFGTKGAIDLRYWAEKEQGSQEVEEYSAQFFEQQVRQAYAEWLEWENPSVADATAASEAVEALLHGPEDIREAHDALYNFVGAGGFELTDTWEWELRDYTFRFVWCCLAIRWGIRQYRALHQGGEQG